MKRKKLLVMELWGVGDLVMATPFLRAATERYEVTLVAKPYSLDLKECFWPKVQIVPFVAPWTAFQHKYQIFSWNWYELFSLIRKLRRSRVDIGLSARWDPRDHALLKAIGADVRMGFPRAGSQLFLNRPVSRPAQGDHRYEYWRAMGEALDIVLPERGSISMPADHNGFILLHTGAAQQVRVWPMERFRQLALRLRNEGFEVQIACDATQRKWWQAMGEADVQTPESISNLSKLIGRAAILIGNDSGPGHVAAFSGVPTFTIFGPQLPELFAPLHRDSEWVNGAPCKYRPCSDYCRFPTPHCLWNLDLETLWPKIWKFVRQHERRITRQSKPKLTEISGQMASHGRGPTPNLRKVLHVNNSADIYGASRMLLRHIRMVDRTRFLPIVILPEKGLLKDCLEAEGVQVVIHPGLSVITRPVFKSWRVVLFTLKFPISVWFLWRFIRRNHVDLVHTNTGVMISPALAAAVAGVPHVWHVRDWFQEFQRFWVPYSWYIRRFSSEIVAVSRAVADQFRPEGTAMVIHDGFALEEFRVPKQEWRSEFRKRFNLDDQFVVGCVGRIKKIRKGQEFLVQAVELLKRRGIKVTGLIVGSPFLGNEEHLTQIHELVMNLKIKDQIVFTGELPDARPAYAAMDILALTSAQPEPFGGVVMEAMAMGVPVIATNIGGSLDQVDPEITGLLIPPADVEALADAIERLIKNPVMRQRMVVEGPQRVEKLFDLSKMTRKLESVFKKLLDDNRLA